MDAKLSLGEPRTLISRSALVHNARLIRQHLAPAVKICAILKADAYGHDASIVLDTLTNFGTAPTDSPLIDAVAVASIDEAEALPPTSLPVLIFRPVENVFMGRQREKLEAAIRAGWVLTVTTPTAIDDIARIALGCGKRATLQVMVDTGMTRSGASPQSIIELVRKIDGRPSLRLWGVCTHFASSEESDNPFTGEQLARFHASIAAVSARSGKWIRHAGNSGAVFFHPGSHLDMVRPGISLFGIDPTGRPQMQRKLRPVLKWTAPIIELLDLPAGGSVGYNQAWSATRPTRVALLPVGYADGYLRCFSNRAVMMLHSKPARVIGKVSMDLTTLDVTDHPHVRVGDEVTLLDSDPLSPASVYQLAKFADTIPYEIFCRIGSRIRRIAIDPTDSEPRTDGTDPISAWTDSPAQ